MIYFTAFLTFYSCTCARLVVALSKQEKEPSYDTLHSTYSPTFTKCLHMHCERFILCDIKHYEWIIKETLIRKRANELLICGKGPYSWWVRLMSWPFWFCLDKYKKTLTETQQKIQTECMRFFSLFLSLYFVYS